MDDILTLVDHAIARWGTRELVSSGEAIDLLLDIRQAHWATCDKAAGRWVFVFDEEPVS
jgi:hypothetical protein